jgi:23S rRNA pseudouridine1911/1915/1917 synthase
MREVVPDALAGERIDRAVAMLTGASRADASKLVDEGRVRVDGRPVATRSRRLEAGETLEVDVPEPEAVAGPQAETGVDVPVVHADGDVIVVDKPPALVVHPGAGNSTGTLVHGLLARFPELAGVGQPERPGIVHRLDKGTSGLLVVARTPAAYDSLVAQLQARTVEREYLALVWGSFDAPRGMVDAPIGRSGRRPTSMAVSERGREARTAYAVERTWTGPVEVSLVTCRLETGRTHQIRVHLAAIGHPVVGDSRYGGARQSLPAPRPVLHAAHLAFDHPGTGDRMVFESSVPDDMAAVLRGLGPPDGEG